MSSNGKNRGRMGFLRLPRPYRPRATCELEYATKWRAQTPAQETWRYGALDRPVYVKNLALITAV
jgi:hypothetical protein